MGTAERIYQLLKTTVGSRYVSFKLILSKYDFVIVTNFVTSSAKHLEILKTHGFVNKQAKLWS